MRELWGCGDDRNQLSLSSADVCAVEDVKWWLKAKSSSSDSSGAPLCIDACYID